VTQPSHPSEANAHDALPASESLRERLSRDLLGDCLSLGHIDSELAYDFPAAPLAARQERLLTAVRSLLADGLLVVGDIVGGTDPDVMPWSSSVDVTMEILRERYVDQYEDSVKWEWTTWFALTESGRRAAEAPEA
jgi:hypothetical protein